MPKYIQNLAFTDCWASVGNITFYHRNGQCYYKAKAQPAFPYTAGQRLQISLHKRAIAAWQSISHEEQLEWNALATQVKSKRPPYDSKSHISGYNLFVSAYHGYASIGNEHIPEPKPVPIFPNISLRLLRSIQVGENIHMTFKIENPPSDLHKYELASRIQLVKAGTGSNPGKMRNYMAEIDKNAEATFIIPSLSESKSLTVHMRFFLIDRTTGHRSTQTKQSENITIYNS